VHIQTVLFGNAKGFMHYAGIHFFYSLVATKILNRQLFLYDNVTLRCALSTHLTDEPFFGGDVTLISEKAFSSLQRENIMLTNDDETVKPSAQLTTTTNHEETLSHRTNLLDYSTACNIMRQQSHR
jgi:hypothetical protein